MQRFVRDSSICPRLHSDTWWFYTCIMLSRRIIERHLAFCLQYSRQEYYAEFFAEWISWRKASGRVFSSPQSCHWCRSKFGFDTTWVIEDCNLEEHEKATAPNSLDQLLMASALYNDGTNPLHSFLVEQTSQEGGKIVDVDLTHRGVFISSINAINLPAAYHTSGRSPCSLPNVCH